MEYTGVVITITCFGKSWKRDCRMIIFFIAASSFMYHSRAMFESTQSVTKIKKQYMEQTNKTVPVYFQLIIQNAN